MNEVDVERHRLWIRVGVTKFAIFLSIVFAIYFVIEYLNSISDINWTWILVAGLLTLVVDKRLERPVRNFYEKRLLNSKSKQHTL